MLVDDDVGDLGHVGHQAHPLHQLHLAGLRQVAAADVGVVRPQGGGDVVERQLVFRQPCRIEQDVILLFVAAPTVHLGHAGNRAGGV